MKIDLYEFRQEVYEDILDTLTGLEEKYQNSVRLNERQKKCASVAFRSVRVGLEKKLKPPFEMEVEQLENKPV